MIKDEIGVIQPPYNCFLCTTDQGFQNAMPSDHKCFLNIRLFQLLKKSCLSNFCWINKLNAYCTYSKPPCGSNYSSSARKTSPGPIIVSHINTMINFEDIKTSISEEFKIPFSIKEVSKFLQAFFGSYVNLINLK